MSIDDDHGLAQSVSTSPHGSGSPRRSGRASRPCWAPAFAACSGQKIAQLNEQLNEQHGDIDVKDASTPSAGTPAEIAVWQKRRRASQYLVPLLSGADIVLNSYLVQTYRPGAAVKALLRGPSDRPHGRAVTGRIGTCA